MEQHGPKQWGCCLFFCTLDLQVSLMAGSFVAGITFLGDGDDARVARKVKDLAGSLQ